MNHFRRMAIIGMLTLVAVLLGASCGGGAEIAEVDITASEYSFALPGTVEGGLTRLSMTNTGAEDHHIQLLRLNDGVTQEELDETIQTALAAVETQGEAALFGIFEKATPAGGPSIVSPGGSGATVMDLLPGEYSLICFIASPSDGIPHIAKGMVASLKVGAAPDDRPDEPDSAATVNLNDFAFSGFPASFSPGESTIKVTNVGAEPHEMVLARLKGISVEDLREALLAPPDPAAGPPPLEFVGGIQAVLPGTTAWASVNLEAGDYAAICFIPSLANEGAPHFSLGMLSGFSVK